ncbi:hypothetical protein OJ998_25290 [Solirubrobacter taibaiensis]|nr:hypothetical protein [Solirubrobacter taibaiensis]
MRLVLVLLIALLFAAPAHAAPRALAAVGEDEGFVLSGDRVVFTQTNGRKIRVLSMPLAGGAAQTIFTYTAPPGRLAYGEQLVATPTRVAMLLAHSDRNRQSTTTQVLAGTATGGWSVVVPPRASGKDLPFANVVQLAGDDVVTYERLSWEQDEFELALYDPLRRVLPLPVGTLFHGDLAIRSERGPLDEAPRERVLVTNWRTGEPVTAAEFDDIIKSYEVATDGRALVTVGDTLLEIAPGGAVTRLTEAVDSPMRAGERVLFFRTDGIGVFERNGAKRRFGVRTEQLERFVTDGNNVLWSANGCLLLAPITDPAARAPGPGPCARSEAALTLSVKGRTARVKVRCVAAPAGGCRGTIELRIAGQRAGQAPVRLAVGKTVERTVQLSRSGAARATFLERG